VASIEGPLVAGSAAQRAGATTFSRRVLAAFIGTGVASRLEEKAAGRRSRCWTNHSTVVCREHASQHKVASMGKAEGLICLAGLPICAATTLRWNRRRASTLFTMLFSRIAIKSEDAPFRPA
jgi:hypothetical protein